MFSSKTARVHRLFIQTAKTRALKCKSSAGDMIIKKPEIYCSAYSDVVITYDLHSNSGAIKLNQTGGMLKHLRTGRLVVVL